MDREMSNARTKRSSVVTCIGRKAASIVLVAVVVFNVSACSDSVTAIGAIGGGVATKLLLNDLDDHATHIVQNAAAAGSLLSSKAARDVQLLIDATRQNLHDELDKQWDRLDSDKISLLREIDSKLSQIEDTGKDFGRLEDTVYLDTDSLVSKIPFAEKMPRIRKVEGSSQYYKSQGTYKIRITSNLFAPFGPEVQITVGDKPLAQVQSEPPYAAVLEMDVKTLEPYFKDFQLAYVPVTISTQIEQGSFFSKKKAKYAFTIPIELFPKYPASYQMDQAFEAEIVDPTAVAVAPGAFMTVPGCGDSGCNAYYNVCTNFPLGAQPIGTVNLVDTFSGWGGFGAVTYGPSQACQVYWQHSHNVARNVKIDVAYHPLKPEIQHRPIDLSPIVVGGQRPLCTPLNQDSKGVPLQSEAIVQKNDKSVACWIQFGVTYSADFDPAMKGYTLAVRAFNGENYAATESRADSGIDIKDTGLTSFKRATIKLKEPSW
jgi:hypothetical protein